MANKYNFEKLGFREYHRRLMQCRLCRLVAMSIMAAILVIETVILIPSYTDRKHEVIDLMTIEAVSALALTKTLIDSTMVEDSDSLWKASLDNTSLKGLYYAAPDGMKIQFGELPAPENVDRYHAGIKGDKTTFKNHQDFDVLVPKAKSGFDYDLLLRLDGEPVHEELADFVWNVAGLVVIISLFVTISSMMIVGYTVLQPLIGLREAFVKAGGDPDHPEKYLVESQRQDEIGDLMASFNRMLLRTGQVLDELHRSQQAMEQTNMRLEDEVGARTKSLQESNEQLTREVHERQELEEKARELARIPAENPNPVLRILQDGSLRYANEPSQPILDHWGVGINDALPDFWRKAAQTCLECRTAAHYELSTGDKAFELDFLPVPDTDVVNVYGRDVSEARMAHERLEHLARHDTLTALPNRSFLLSQLEDMDYPDQLDGIEPLDETPAWALMVIDIDHFMALNESLGPEIGDQLLVEFAARLQRRLEGHFLARLDGDAFAVIAEDLPDPMAVTRLARRLVELGTKPFRIDSQDIEITLSVGIALCPHDGQTATDLMNAAELALQRAKAEGRNTFRLFDPELGARTRERRLMEKDLRHAIERGELELHYQPKFDLQSRDITSAEALLRWNHPERGFVSPGDFIPLAEETGLIDTIGDWVLERAVIDFAALNKSRQSQKQPGLPVAVNLSARQLLPEKLAARVRALLNEHQMDVSWLELEITESMIMEDVEEAVCVLQELSDIGVQLSIDDFGTGYSSLNYLRRLPVNKMKIDRSFVLDIEHDQGAAAVAKSVMGLATALNMKTIAEGIETEGQLEILQGMHCHEGQGWLVSKALPYGDFSKALTSPAPDEVTRQSA